MKKKAIYLAMLGAMALVSCNKQMGGGNGLFQPGDGEIYFGTRLIEVNSKAVAEATADGLQAGGFKAAVVVDADNIVMFNEAVAYNAGVYTVPDATYFYPQSGTISAYATYPKTEVISVADGVATIAYSQNDTEDLVVAKATGISKQNDAIELTFDHALSQLVFKAKGLDASVDYKLKLIEVTAPSSGTYRYASNDWGNLGTATAYSAYENEGATVSTAEYQTFGESMTFLPGEVSLRIEWECYSKADGTLVASFDQSVPVTLEQGHRLTISLLLPNISADELKFTVNVNVWDDESQTPDIKLAVAKAVACAEIDAAMGDSEDPDVIAAGTTAKTNINAATTIAAVEAARAAGLAAIKAAKDSGPAPNVYYDMENIGFETLEPIFGTFIPSDQDGHHHDGNIWAYNESEFIFNAKFSWLDSSGVFDVVGTSTDEMKPDELHILQEFTSGIEKDLVELERQIEYPVSAFAMYTPVCSRIITKKIYEVYRYETVGDEILTPVTIATFNVYDVRTQLDPQQTAIPGYEGQYVYGHGHYDAFGYGDNAGGTIIWDDELLNYSF